MTIAHRFTITDPEKDLLGRGGMGEVYRAQDTQTGETVAVKTLNPEIVARSPDLLERFQREGEALRRLDHPNIVHMLAAVEQDGRHYLVMEYVGGGSLQDLLKSQSRLPAQRVVEVGLDLADALTRAHRLGILHRDLKPANVLLAEDSTPRLADFGIAYQQSVPHLTQTGILVGTVDYLSPEVIQGQPPDERSDIWSFGVLLYELLSGQLPFYGENLTAKLTAILTQPTHDITASVPGIPDALADLVYRMLEKDPQQRIPSVRLVGVELEAILKGRRPIEVAPGRHGETRFGLLTPAPDMPKHNLPAQPTPFVGRQAELCELARLLADPIVRLVTIVGLGGMGKTRLALEAGAAELERYRNGVYFVPLAPLGSAEAIVPTIAQILNFTFYEGADPRLQLLDYLRQKQILLILDNFEHLLNDAEAERTVTDILRTASDIKLLVTSRIRLGLLDEHLFHLEGMDFPDWETWRDAIEYSAIKLFLQSARRAQPGFELAPGDLRYVVHICRLVDGMPLGILLAAAWVELLTPAEIAAEMQHSLDFLQTDLSSMSERQRSIRMVFDYSWNLLTETEQDVFQSLSVFRGGFTREAAQEVTGATLRDLLGLANKSLIHRAPTGRYEVHELLRQYAAEKLSELPGVEQVIRERHCAYFTEFLHNRETLLFSSARVTAVGEIASDVENWRAAWDWAVAHAQVEQMDQCLQSMAEFFRLRGWLREAHDCFKQAADRLELEARQDPEDSVALLLSRLRAQQGRFCDYLGLVDDAPRFLLASVSSFRTLGSFKDAAYTLCYLGGCEALYGGFQAEPCHQALEIFEQLNDQRGKALALRGLAWVALHQGNYPLARDRFQESLDGYRQLGDPQGMAESLAGRGYIAWIMGEYETARRLHQEMLKLCHISGDRRGIARALISLAQDALGLRLDDEGLRLFCEGLALYREMGDPWGTADALGDMGEVENTMGNYAQAAEFAQQSLDMHGSKVERALEGWELRVVGDAACGMGDLPRARKYYRLALERDSGVWRPSRLLFTLVGIARLLTEQGQLERGLELLAFVLQHPSTWQWTKDRAAPLLSYLEATLPPGAATAAEERGRARDLEKTIQGFLLELGA